MMDKGVSGNSQLTYAPKRGYITYCRRFRNKQGTDQARRSGDVNKAVKEP